MKVCWTLRKGKQNHYRVRESVKGFSGELARICESGNSAGKLKKFGMVKKHPAMECGNRAVGMLMDVVEKML